MVFGYIGCVKCLKECEFLIWKLDFGGFEIFGVILWEFKLDGKKKEYFVFYFLMWILVYKIEKIGWWFVLWWLFDEMWLILFWMEIYYYFVNWVVWLFECG